MHPQKKLKILKLKILKKFRKNYSWENLRTQHSSEKILQPKNDQKKKKKKN